MLPLNRTRKNAYWNKNLLWTVCCKYSKKIPSSRLSHLPEWLKVEMYLHFKKIPTPSLPGSLMLQRRSHALKDCQFTVLYQLYTKTKGAYHLSWEQSVLPLKRTRKKFAYHKKSLCRFLNSCCCVSASAGPLKVCIRGDWDLLDTISYCEFTQEELITPSSTQLW